MNRKSFFKGKSHVPCCWCSKPLTYEESTKEHLIPRSHGGNGTFANIDIACSPCNNERGHITEIEKMARRARRHAGKKKSKKIVAWQRFVKHYKKWEARINKWEEIHKTKGIKLKLYKLEHPKEFLVRKTETGDEEITILVDG